MEEGPSSGDEDGGASKTSGGAGVSELPANRHGNLRAASGDPNLSQIMKEIKSSKSPAVINYGASWVINEHHVFDLMLLR